MAMVVSRLRRCKTLGSFLYRREYCGVQPYKRVQLRRAYAWRLP